MNSAPQSVTRAWQLSRIGALFGLLSLPALGQAPEFVVHSVPSGSHVGPRVAMAPGGGSLVAWTETSGLDGDGSGVFLRRVGDDGRPLGPEVTVTAHLPGDQVLLAAAGLEGDGYVIAWGTPDPASGGNALRGRVLTLDASGQPTGPAQRLRPGLNEPVSSVTLVALSAGEFVAVYDDPRDGSVSWSRHDADGAPAAIEVATGSSGKSPQRLPSAARTADGHLWVAWEAGNSLFLQSFEPLGGQSLGLAQARVNAGARGPALTPCADGSLWLAFTRPAEAQPNERDVFGVRLSGSGDVLTAETRLHNLPAGRMRAPAISSAGQNRLVSCFPAQLAPGAPRVASRAVWSGSGQRLEPTQPVGQAAALDVEWVATAADRIGSSVTVWDLASGASTGSSSAHGRWTLSPVCPEPLSYCFATGNGVGTLPYAAWSGAPSLQQGSLRIELHDGLPESQVTLLRGDQAGQTPFLGSTLCVGGTLQALTSLWADAEGGASLAIEGSHALIGQTEYYQWFQRDGSSSISSVSSDALRVRWCP